MPRDALEYLLAKVEAGVVLLLRKVERSSMSEEEVGSWALAAEAAGAARGRVQRSGAEGEAGRIH